MNLGLSGSFVNRIALIYDWMIIVNKFVCSISDQSMYSIVVA
jgi:hypothetical protein